MLPVICRRDAGRSGIRVCKPYNAEVLAIPRQQAADQRGIERLDEMGIATRLD